MFVNSQIGAAGTAASMVRGKHTGGQSIAADDHSDKMRIAMKIARRIMNGDNVPPCDEEFLLEHSPGLFKLAISLRRHDNDDPEDYDSASRDNNRRRPVPQLVQQPPPVDRPSAATPSLDIRV